MAKKKKEVELKEVSRTEINGAIIIKYEDGSVKIIPAPIKLTGEELAEMDFEELEDVCDDKDLETDPDDYDEDDIEKLRKAIAKELGLKLPAKKEAKGKGKKGKK